MQNKSINIILVSIFIIISNLFSQNDVSIFDKWVGEWEGVYEVNGYKNKELMVNDWALNKAYFRMDIQGSMADEPEMKYSSTTYLTLDNDGNIVGWDFSDGGYKDFIALKGKINENVVKLTGTNPDYSVKINFEYKAGKIIRKAEFKKKEKDSKLITETIFKKVK